MADTTEKSPFLQAVSDTRATLESMGEVVKNLKTFPAFPVTADVSEVMENITLAFRHVEDAKMRLGKVVQAYQGGRSVYDEAPKANVA